MKKLKFLVTAAAACLLAACTANPSKEASKEGSDPSSQEVSQNSQEQSNSQAQSQSNSQATSTSQAVQHIMEIDYATKKADFVDKQFAVTTTVENGYTLVNGVCTISVAGAYTVTGYLKGQILITVVGVELSLNNAYLENDQGKAPIYCNVAYDSANTAEQKLEVKGKATNYIVQYGGTYDKNNKDTAAAIVSDCDLDLGGSGLMYIVGALKHGVKANTVKVKSEGYRYVQGTNDGSAVNCTKFVDKAASASKLYAINTKNAIKADNAIELSSEGTTIYMYDCEVGMKTDKKSGEEHITLGAGVIIRYDHVTTPFDTNDGKLTNNATINPAE